MSAPTDQALLAAEAKDDATLVDTTPTAPADVQLDAGLVWMMKTNMLGRCISRNHNGFPQ